MNPKELEEKTQAYRYLVKKDSHLANLFHWINTLQDLQREIRKSEQDDELEDEITCVIKRLIDEIGVRVMMLFP